MTLLGAAGGCKRSSEPAGPAPSASAAPAIADTHHLDEAAKAVLVEIATLETTKDVTCWTSFRQLDSFISSNPYSNFAVLAKIAAVKALLRAAWEKASRASPDATLGAAALTAAVAVDAGMPEQRKNELASFATDLGMKAYKDYRTTSEHWRVLLGVIGDEISMSGGGTTLKPVSPEGLAALADLATRLSLRVLEASGQLARDERSPMIEGSHVKRAHAALSKQLELVNAPREVKALSADQTKERLAPLTKTLIEGKIRALQVYNKDSKDLLTDLNRVSKNVPLTQEALDGWMKDLQSFTHFVAGGYEPMQSDNFLADGDFAPKDQPRKPWVDATQAENATLQLFPHVIMPNGDVKLRFEPNPGAPGDKPRKAYDELMLDYQQNAVRDTAVHWILMQNVWKERAFAMDPFAAEYLSEVLSMMVTHYILRGEQLAKAAKKTAIDKEIGRAVRDKGYVMVMPRSEESKAWTPEQWKKKDAVLARYPKQLFRDASATAGLPIAPPRLTEPKDGDAGAFDIQQAMGAGIATGDVDKDGYPDLFVAGEGMGRLYLNRGKEAPGRFRDATEAYGVPAGLDDSHGALLVDLDGDGSLELIVVRSEHPSLVLEQKGGKFVDAAARIGLRTHRGAHVAQVFDYDRDGDLDVYVGYYGSDAANRGTSKKNVPSMDGRNGSPHELWRRGPDGVYTEVGQAAGVADVGWTLGTSTFDYDGDGDQDLFLANDFGADVFYQNKGDGTFVDVAPITETADRGSGMNVSITDANGDGWPDLYVSNIDMFSKNIKVVFPDDHSTINNYDSNLQKSFQYLSGNKLFINPGDGAGKKPFLADQGARFEPGDRGWSWAGVFFDYENDGDEDMYLSTGWLETSFASNQKKQMFLFEDGVFYLGPTGSPEAFASNGRSAIAVDVDRDGDLDVVLANFRQAPAVFENTQATTNKSIRLRLRGRAGNTGAVGARVTITAAGKKQRREVSCGNGYLGQNDEIVQVGVGAATSAEATVRWPNGSEQTVKDVAPGSIVDIVESAPAK